MNGAPHDVEFEGKEIKLGRTTYVVPPLSLGAIKKHGNRIQQFAQLSIEQQMELTAAIAHAALKRNYADITLERVEELVDLRNMGEVFLAVVESSGFTATTEGNAPGGTSQPTGQPSTPI